MLVLEVDFNDDVEVGFGRFLYRDIGVDGDVGVIVDVVGVCVGFVDLDIVLDLGLVDGGRGVGLEVDSNDDVEVGFGCFLYRDEGVDGDVDGVVDVDSGCHIDVDIIVGVVACVNVVGDVYFDSDVDVEVDVDLDVDIVFIIRV